MKKQASILIVEDDDFLRTLAFNKLTTSGFKVDVATDGQAGFDKVINSVYDVLILDLLLPVLDGFQVLHNLAKEKALNKQHVIVFSNLGSEADIKQVVDLGIKHYMIKSSFTLDELVVKINEVLEDPLK